MDIVEEAGGQGGGLEASDQQARVKESSEQEVKQADPTKATKAKNLGTNEAPVDISVQSLDENCTKTSFDNSVQSVDDNCIKPIVENRVQPLDEIYTKTIVDNSVQPLNDNCTEPTVTSVHYVDENCVDKSVQMVAEESVNTSLGLIDCSETPTSFDNNVQFEDERTKIYIDNNIKVEVICTEFHGDRSAPFSNEGNDKTLIDNSEEGKEEDICTNALVDSSVQVEVNCTETVIYNNVQFEKEKSTTSFEDNFTKALIKNSVQNVDDDNCTETLNVQFEDYTETAIDISVQTWDFKCTKAVVDNSALTVEDNSPETLVDNSIQPWNDICTKDSSADIEQSLENNSTEAFFDNNVNNSTEDLAENMPKTVNDNTSKSSDDNSVQSVGDSKAPVDNNVHLEVFCNVASAVISEQSLKENCPEVIVDNSTQQLDDNGSNALVSNSFPIKADNSVIAHVDDETLTEDEKVLHVEIVENTSGEEEEDTSKFAQAQQTQEEVELNKDNDITTLFSEEIKTIEQIEDGSKTIGEQPFIVKNTAEDRLKVEKDSNNLDSDEENIINDHANACTEQLHCQGNIKEQNVEDCKVEVKANDAEENCDILELNKECFDKAELPYSGM